MGSLEAHEQRVNQYSKQPMEQAFHIKANFSGRRGASFYHQRGGRSFYRKDSYGRAGESQNHSRGRSRSRGRGRANFQPRIGSNSYCSICKRTGHETQDCFYKCTRCKNSTHSIRNCWLKDKEDDYGENNTANFSKEEDQLFYSCMNVEHKEEEVWYLDSGCSHHITGDRSSFETLDEEFSSHIELGDNKRVEIKERGDVAIHSNKGNKKCIHYVFYYPSIGQNLLSVGQIMRRGYRLIFDHAQCEIYNKNTNQKVVVVKMSSNNIFLFNMKSLYHVATRSEHLDDSQLWYLRYGHLNYNGLQLLKKKDLVSGLPSIQNQVGICEGCVYGKMHRFPFPKTVWRAKAPLELVHADICGPTRTPSLNNKRYFLLFVNDFSRMIWIYFLNNKSDVFSVFLQFKALIEKQSGCQIKILRTLWRRVHLQAFS